VFSDRLSLPVVGTHDPKMLHQALAKLTAYNDGVRSSDFNAVSDWSLIRQFGRSAVWDAVYVGGSLVVGEDGRAIVVLLSNSQDTASWLLSDGPDDASWNRQERQKTVDGLVRSGIVVDTIWPSRSISARADFAYARPRPTAVSDATGGEAFYSRDDKLVQRLTSRFEALRSGYVITFTPTGVKRDDGWHRLTVRLKNKSGSVKARDRYFASAPAKSVGR
jgi:hypothetical protein